MPTELILARIQRALMLDTAVFEESRDDAAFTPYVLGAAAVAALLGGIGTFLWSVVVLDETEDFFLEATLLGTIFLIILWGAGIGLAYVILAQVYRENIAPDALARVMALGHIPFALSLLIFIPEIGYAFGLLSVAGAFLYTNYGIRAAYPAIDPMRVMLAVLAAFAVWCVVMPILTSTDNQFAPGPFTFEWAENVLDDAVEAQQQLR